MDNMTPDELTKALEQVLKATDRVSEYLRPGFGRGSWTGT